MPAEAQTLKVAFLHLAPETGNPQGNLDDLVRALEEAAHGGAQLVVAPELALSGYCFRDRQEAHACSEHLESASVARLAERCRHHGLTLVLGLVERDATTDLLHNTALALGPDGKRVGHHRKLVAERRWATPGRPGSEGSLVHTPWGTLGLQVCADTYFALTSRAQVLAGAELLVVIANWPPSGVDPRKIWRARAMENGVGLLACNRTGIDRGFDCQDAPAFAVRPDGSVLLDEVHPSARVIWVDWPLVSGRFQRLSEALEGRRPRDWTALGLDVNGLGDTTYLWGGLPSGPVALHLGRPNLEQPHVGRRVVLLPEGEASIEALHRLEGRAWPTGLILSGSDALGPFLASSEGMTRLLGRDHLLAVEDGLRLGLARPEAMRHPEAAVALAKEGCDLLLLPGGTQDVHLDPILATRCLERLPLALACPGHAVLWQPPEGHGPWLEHRLGADTVEIPLDVPRDRRRHVFDRIDLDRVLA